MTDDPSNLSPPRWPLPVNVTEEDGPLVKLSELPPKYKRIAWTEILASSPALASLLKDPLVSAAIKQFDAELFVGAQFAPSLPVYKLKRRISSVD